MPEVELEAVELKVPVEVCTEMAEPPSVASADSSASEPSGKLHPVALHTQAAVAALQRFPEVRTCNPVQTSRLRRQDPVRVHSHRD